jgi:hypothetical protein
MDLHLPRKSGNLGLHVLSRLRPRLSARGGETTSGVMAVAPRHGGRSRPTERSSVGRLSRRAGQCEPRRFVFVFAAFRETRRSVMTATGGFIAGLKTCGPTRFWIPSWTRAG